MPTSYETKTKAELKVLLQSRSLPCIRRETKADFVARLRRYDVDHPPQIIPAYERAGIFPFFRLPSEIRTMVYKELLTLKMPSHRYWAHPGWDPGWAHPQILSADRAIHQEASSLLYAFNTMSVWIFRDIVSFGTEIFDVQIPERRRNRRAPVPLSPWLQLPVYLYKCQNLHVWLGISNNPLTRDPPDVFARQLQGMVVHAYAFVDTILLNHQHLRNIKLELGVDRGQALDGPVVSDPKMAQFERRFLDAFGQLRGLRQVQFIGLHFVNQAYMDRIKRLMTS